MPSLSPYLYTQQHLGRKGGRVRLPFLHKQNLQIFSFWEIKTKGGTTFVFTTRQYFVLFARLFYSKRVILTPTLTLFIIMTVLLFNMYFMEISMVNLRRKPWTIGNSKNSHLSIEVKLLLYQTTSNIFTEQSWNFISLEVLQHNIITFICNHIPSGNSQ